MRKSIRLGISGGIAGGVNGLFGAGGGMVLVPLLTGYAKLDEQVVFPSSVATIFPVCIISALLNLRHETIDFLQFLPYLIGGVLGGLAAGLWGGKIPTVWLHRALGALILWGGVRYLC